MKQISVARVACAAFLALIANTSQADCGSKAQWQHEHSAPTDTSKSTTVSAPEGASITICRDNYPIGKKPTVTIKFDSQPITIDEFKCETRSAKKAAISSRASRNGPNQPTIVKGTSEVCT